MRLLATAHDRNHYEMTHDGQPVATLALSAGGTGRVILASGVTLRLRRDSPLLDNYTFTAENTGPGGEPIVALARAIRPNPLRRSYLLTGPGYALTLRAESPWRGDYLVLRNGASVGAIRQAPRGRDASADLPDDLAEDAAIAVFSFILVRWRQGHARVSGI